MKNNWILWGAVAVGAYLIWKKMKKTSSNPTGREIAPPPVGTTKPALIVGAVPTSNNDLI